MNKCYCSLSPFIAPYPNHTFDLPSSVQPSQRDFRQLGSANFCVVLFHYHLCSPCLACSQIDQASAVSSPNTSSTVPLVLIRSLASHFVVLAHSLGLNLPLIPFAPKYSRKAFSPVPISSSLPGESTPVSHCWLPSWVRY